MASFYCDEDLTVRIGTELASRGHDVLRVFHDLGQRSPDPQVLSRAARLQRILITHNHDDFLMLHRAWLQWPLDWNVETIPVHHGILAVAQIQPVGVPRVTPIDVVNAIERLADTLPMVTNRKNRFVAGQGWQEQF